MTTESPTKYYAPQVRVVDASTDALIGATPVARPADAGTGGGGGAATEREPMVHLDVVSVSVTLVSSGVGQLTLVLNNQRFDAEGRPTTPPWKYNGLDRIKFGQRLRVDMTYGEQPWTKMILAQVNSVKFAFPSSGPAQVTIIGEDLACLLRRLPDEDKTYPRGTGEEAIAGDVATRATGPAFAGATRSPVARDASGFVENRGSQLAWPELPEDTPPLTHAKDQTFLTFLQGIADRMDFEIFVDFTRNYLPADETGEAPPPPAAGEEASPAPQSGDPNEVLLHFEPARSLLRGGEPPFVVDLAWGVNLAEFTPTVKVWDLFTAIRLRGRSRDRLARVREAIDTPEEINAIIAEDLGRISGGPTLVPATELRHEFLRDVAGLPMQAPTEVNITNYDRERGLLQAKAVFRAKAREMCAVQATTVGFPSLRPGMHVNVTQLYAPFDGLYYVTKAVHTIDGAGFKTQLTLRRPGLQRPSEYPWAETNPATVAATPPPQPEAAEGTP